MCLLALCMSSLEKCLCPFLIRLFVFLILRCMSCLYVLKINPMLVTSLANIFFYYLSVFFPILFMVSFAVQKLLCLIRSHLSIFVFISMTLGGGSKKIMLWFISKSVLCFPLKNFIVAGLPFRCLMHFEFVYGIRECSNFILLHIAVYFSWHHLLKRLSFLPYISLPPLT